MANIEPMIDYLEARRLLEQGDRAGALASLAAAVGADAPNLVLDENLERFLDHRSMPGEVALELVKTEVQRRKR